MGDVAVIYKVMPDGVEVDMESLKGKVEALASEFGKTTIETRDVAFGLKAVMVSIVMPDKGAQPDLIEEKLGNIESVQSVNTESVTLI